MTFLAALGSDLFWVSVFTLLTIWVAHRKNRSKWWALIGFTILPALVLALLPKRALKTATPDSSES